MKIVVLSENTTLSEKFQAEHGLSLYIESENHKILFDTGQSDVFVKNAEKLNIDLSMVDIAILSHGHYDHGGGLEKFTAINPKAPIYISPYAFEAHYSSNGFIGLTESIKTDKFVEVKSPLKTHNLTIYPGGLLPTPYSVEHYGLKLENNAPDDFRHEQYLEIVENGKRILISGCSHKGILNIADFFEPDVLIGGFHFMKIETNEHGINKLNNAANTLLKHNTHYYTCHCTGIEQFNILKQIMKDKLQYISTGTEFNI